MQPYQYTGNVRRVCKVCEGVNRYPVARAELGADIIRPCGHCAAALNLRVARPIYGRLSDKRPCDARCMGAVGDECECPCGGENHGKDWEPVAILQALATGTPAKQRKPRPEYSEPIAIVEGYHGSDALLRDLQRSLHEYGHLTPRQEAAAQRRYDDAVAPARPAPVAPPAPPATANLSAAVGFLAAARLRGVKWPRLTVPLAAFATDATETVSLVLAGERAAEPGSLRLESATRRVPTAWGDGWAYYGKVARDGTANIAANAPAGLQDALQAIADDPVAAAAAVARLTGYCTFCHTRISTAESLAVGYGDTCAANYGLPWGNRPTR